MGFLHARKPVDTFWRQFRSVTCVESVPGEKLGKQGKIERRQKSTFACLVLSDIDNQDLSMEESRLRQGKKDKPKNLPPVAANGIRILFLVFHHHSQDSFRYELGGDEVIGGQRMGRINLGMSLVEDRQLHHDCAAEATGWKLAEPPGSIPKREPGAR